MAYCFNQIVQKKWDWRSLMVSYTMFDTIFFPIVMPWIFLAIIYQQNLLFRYIKPSPEMISEKYVDLIFTLSSVSFYVSYLLYWQMKRRATTVLYNLENESILRIIEYPLLFMIGIICYLTPAFIIACFGSLFEGGEFRVAEKKAITRKEI